MARFRTFILPIALLSIVALAAACGDGNGDETGDTSATTDTGGTDAGGDTTPPPDDTGGGDECSKPEDCIGQVTLGTCQVAGCNDQGQCEAMTAPVGTGCDDANACTSDDACDAAGACAGTPIADCNPCDTAADCAPFEDGDACNGTLTCAGGTCQLDDTTIVECPPDSDCATYTCTPATGDCAATPINEGGTCEGDPAVLCDVDFLCEDGECVCPGCIPACEGLDCGDDGCGGSCGDCEADETCAAGVCVECTPECTDRVCGDDGCGGSCGDCDANETCNDDGACVCVPDCTDRECGDDGCGGSCGGCEANETCTAEGQCECVPDCDGIECGDDGCGGNCGDCDTGEECSAAGMCIPEGCTPDCSGLECGLDPECGDSCGTCGEFEECVAGTCEVTDPCLGVDDIGCCEGDTVVFCMDSVLQSLDCGAAGRTCGWNVEQGFYDCAAEPTEDPGGTPRECGAFPACPSSCEDAGVACGLHPDCPWLNCGGCDAGEVCDTEVGQCVADPCQGVTFEGCCIDGDVRWCEESQILTEDCPDEEPCGWSSDAGYFVCGGPDDTPAEIDETCPEIECPTTCEEAGVECGPHPDCGWVDCGGCDAGQLCGGGACMDITATALTCDTQVTGTNAGGTSEFDTYDCGFDASGPEVAYELTLAAADDVYFAFNEDTATGGVPLAGDLEIYIIGQDGGCAFVDTTGTVSLEAGTYYVFVDGYQGATSDYALLVDCAGECAEPGCGDRECGPAPGAFCMGFECGAGCDDGFLCDEEAGLCEAIPECDAAAAGGDIACGDAPVTVSGDTTDLLNYVDTYVGCGAAGYGGPEVWYTFTPSCTGDVTVDLASPVADMAILVLEGTCRADNCFTGADNTVGAGDESVTFTAEMGTTYFIVVEGWLEEGSDVPSAGPYDLTVTCACTCVPDCSGVECGPDPVCGQDCGGCDDGLVCSDQGTCVSDPCLGVTDIGCCDGDTAYTCTENGLVAEDCGADGCGWNDFFGLIFWYGCGGVGDDPTGTYDRACDFAACDNATICSEQGWECGTGCPGESCGTCEAGEYCTADKTCAPIEFCDAATEAGTLECGDGPQTTTGDTSTSTSALDTYSCASGYAGPEQWYTFTPGCTGDVTVSLVGPETADMDLLVLEGECSLAAECAGAGTTGSSNESVTFEGVEGVTYYVVVEGYGADSMGAYDLTVDCQCTCTPDCSQTECGPDPVCGTDCGGCDTGQICDAGACVADPCQGLTFEGCCEDDVAVWCEGGEIMTVRCGEEVALAGCGWSEAGGFFFCGESDTPPAEFPLECPELTCATTCAAEGLSCGPLPGCPWIDCGGCDAGDTCADGVCLPDPCLGVPSWGCCDGTTIRRCVDGEYIEADCDAETPGDICGWYGGDGQSAPGYYCGPSDQLVAEDPTGTFPATCNLATCVNDDFCAAWGRECGPGCPGETCGECAEGEACDPATYTCFTYTQPTCAAPATIACGDVIDGSTVLAESLLGNVDSGYDACDPGYEETGGEDVYAFTLAEAQDVTFGLGGFAGDLDLYVIGSTCTEADCLASSAGTSDELIEGFTAEAGVTYYVVVEGYGGAASAYQLTMSCDTVCVPDCEGLECGDDGCGGSCGDCEAGETCNEGLCEAVSFASCDAATPVACGDSLSGTTVDAPDSLNGYACSFLDESGGEVVYTFSVESDQEVTVDLTGLDADLELFVLEGACDPASCPGDAWKSTSEGDESVTFLATAGTTYSIVVDGWSGQSGPYDLAVACADPCVPDCGDRECGLDPVCNTLECGTCTGGLVCDDGVCVDACADLQGDLVCDDVVIGDTTGGVSLFDGYSCVGWDESGPEHIYSFTAPTDGVYTFSMFGSADSDFDLFVLDATCDASACVTHGDSAVTLSASAGETYFIVVDGYFGAAGEYHLVASCADVTVVSMVDFAFVVDDVTVGVGGTVRWINLGAVNHTSTSTDDPVVWDSGVVAPGDSFDFTFDTPGTFPYQCTIHPQMTGVVTVE